MKKGKFLPIINIIIIAICFNIITISSSFGDDLQKYKSQINKLADYWNKILTDQKKLLPIVKRIKNSGQLSSKKATIINLRKSIDNNAKYRRSIMKKLPEKDKIREKIAKNFSQQMKQYRNYNKQFFKERKRIKKLKGCKNTIKNIDSKHKLNKKAIIQKLKREGKMWKKVKKIKKKKGGKVHKKR